MIPKKKKKKLSERMWRGVKRQRHAEAERTFYRLLARRLLSEQEATR